MSEMVESYFDKCRRDVCRYADHLRSRAEKGEINASAITNLLRGYLDQRGFYVEHREALLTAALQGAETGK